MLLCVFLFLSIFPQLAHLITLHISLLPFLPHDQPGYETPDGHCFLFGRHNFHSNILPLHASQAVAEEGLQEGVLAVQGGAVLPHVVRDEEELHHCEGVHPLPSLIREGQVCPVCLPLV